MFSKRFIKSLVEVNYLKDNY